MITVNYRVDSLIQNIQKYASLAGDLRPVLLLIQGKAGDSNPNTIIGGINTQFIRQGSFFGTTWKPLSSQYAGWKAKNFPGQSILRRSDKLFKSITVPGSTGNVQNLDWTRLTWGVADDAVPYAKYHISEAPRKKIPRRAFLGITKEQKNTWMKLISAYITDVMDQTGGT